MQQKWPDVERSSVDFHTQNRVLLSRLLLRFFVCALRSSPYRRCISQTLDSENWTCRPMSAGWSPLDLLLPSSPKPVVGSNAIPHKFAIFRLQIVQTPTSPYAFHERVPLDSNDMQETIVRRQRRPVRPEPVAGREDAPQRQIAKIICEQVVAIVSQGEH